MRNDHDHGREYLTGEHDATCPDVVKAYGALREHLTGWYLSLLRGGRFRFEFVARDPYASSAAMLAHHAQTGILRIWQDLGDMPADHPMAQPLPYGHPARNDGAHTWNDVFRACHDSDHVVCRLGFSPKHETILAHVAAARMGPVARAAWWAETVAQTAAYKLLGTFADQRAMVASPQALAALGW